MVNEARGKSAAAGRRAGGPGMNRSDLAQELATRGGLTIGAARRILDLLFGAANEAGLIPGALEGGGCVRISGFGAFEVRDLPPRRLHDPRTGVLRRLPARRTVAFRAGVALKDRLR